MEELFLVKLERMSELPNAVSIFSIRELSLLHMPLSHLPHSVKLLHEVWETYTCISKIESKPPQQMQLENK